MLIVPFTGSSRNLQTSGQTNVSIVRSGPCCHTTATYVLPLGATNERLGVSLGVTEQRGVTGGVATAGGGWRVDQLSPTRL